MPKSDDLSRSLVALDQDSTLIAVIEMSQSSWLVGGLLPGVAREPLKKLDPDPAALLRLLERWRADAAAAGRRIARTCVAYEAGRDGFWLARWLHAHGVECHVIHPTSVAVSREHRRAKTDRLDIALLKRAFLGWLRGERKHCTMVAVPSVAEEDARRPQRERDTLSRDSTRLINRITSLLALHGIRGFNPKLKSALQRLARLRTPAGEALPCSLAEELQHAIRRLAAIRARIAELEAASQQHLTQAPAAQAPAAQASDAQPHAMIRLIARIRGVGLSTAETLVRELLSRELRDRRAVARYAGLTGSPDESGARRREKGLAKAGNARVRHVLIQLAWRFLRHQPDAELSRWYRQRTADRRGVTRKTMIVALARKLLVALWQYATAGVLPQGVRLQPAS